MRRAGALESSRMPIPAPAPKPTADVRSVLGQSLPLLPPLLTKTGTRLTFRHLAPTLQSGACSLRGTTSSLHSRMKTFSALSHLVVSIILDQKPGFSTE